MKVIRDTLPYEERKALQQICAHHGITDKAAIRDLERFCAWIHLSDQDKMSVNRVPQAPFLLSFLSMLGIYGKEALND